MSTIQAMSAKYSIDLSDDDALVPVFVPKHLVTRVYALIVEGGSDTELAQPLVRSSHTSADFADYWTTEAIWRAFAESPPSMKNVLLLLASKPDEEIVSDELAKALGPDARWPNLAGTLGAFGRRVRSRYGQSG